MTPPRWGRRSGLSREPVCCALSRLGHNPRMRHTEFWARMDSALGASYARSWAHTFAISELGSRTVEEAFAEGFSPKQVWAAVWRTLDLPFSER